MSLLIANHMLLLDSEGDPAYVVTHWVVDDRDPSCVTDTDGILGVYALPVSAARHIPATQYEPASQKILTEAAPVFLKYRNLTDYTTETFRLLPDD